MRLGELIFDDDGVFYIDADKCGIPMMAVLCDGLSLCIEGCRTYLKVSEVIGWYRRESGYPNSKAYQAKLTKSLVALERAVESFGTNLTRTAETTNP